MTTPTLYTEGYAAGWTPEQLQREAIRRDAVIIDTRLRPYSQQPQWRQAQLESLLGTLRYRHMEEFGNLNYRGGPIRLNQPDNGLRKLEAYGFIHSHQPPSLILLCACANHHTCHRTVVADLLAKHLNLPIEHLLPPVDFPPGTLPCITIKGLWAHAILHDGKDIENRTWPSAYRGPLLIQMSKGYTRTEYDADADAIDISIILRRPRPDVVLTPYRGNIIGMVTMTDCVQDHPSRWKMPNTWGHVYTNPVAFAHPSPAKGVPGRLFPIALADLPEATRAAIGEYTL